MTLQKISSASLDNTCYLDLSLVRTFGADSGEIYDFLVMPYAIFTSSEHNVAIPNKRDGSFRNNGDAIKKCPRSFCLYMCMYICVYLCLCINYSP